MGFYNSFFAFARFHLARTNIPKRCLHDLVIVYACVKNKVIGQTRVGLRIGCRLLWVFNIKHWLDLDIRALIIALRTNLNSSPPFAKVWYLLFGSPLYKTFHQGLRAVKTIYTCKNCLINWTLVWIQLTRYSLRIPLSSLRAAPFCGQIQ